MTDLFDNLNMPESAPAATGFDAFWKVYPKKVSKKAAARAYDRALRRHSHDRIMTGVEHLIASGKEWDFIPYPATWLNGERWADYDEPLPGIGGNLEIPRNEQLKAIAQVALKPWGRMRYPRQDLEECVAAGLLTEEQMEQAL